MAEKKTKSNSKSAKKTDKKKIIKILLPVFLVALIAVALIVVLNLPDEETENKEALLTDPAKITDSVDKNNVHQAEPATDANGELEQNGEGELLSYIPRNIKNIKVENTKGTFQIKSYTPVKKTTDENGKEVEETQATEYTIVGFEDINIQPGQPDLVASSVSTLSFKKVVSVDGAKKEFGFDKPRATVTVTYQDKTKAKIIVGAVAPANAGVYIRFGSGKAVYLVEESVVEPLLYNVNDLVAKDVTETVTDGDNASAQKIVLSGTAFKQSITIEACDDETASGNYKIVSPVSCYGDDGACTEVEAGIRGVFANSVVYVNPSDKQLKKYGLKTPYAEILATYPDTTVNLVASKPDSKGYCYIMVKGGNVVYKILSDSVRWTQKSLDDLRSTFFVDNQYTYVKEMDVQYGDKKYSFELTTTNSTVSDENGEDSTIKTTEAKCNGKDVNNGSVQTAFDYMHGSGFARKEITNTKLSGSPVMTITFKYSDGVRSDDVMKFYASGKQRIYVTVNGEQISYLYKNSVSNLQKLMDTAAKSKSDEN